MLPDPLKTQLGQSASMRAPHLRPYLWLALITAGPVLLIVLNSIPALDEFTFHNALSHLLLSGDASLLGAALAVLMLRVAYRARDGRVFLVGMGFLSTASMLIVYYRLTVPGPLVDCCAYLLAWPPVLSLAIGGMFFGLSGLDLTAQINRWVMRQAGVGLVLYLGAWFAYSWVFLIWAPLLPTYSASSAISVAAPQAKSMQDGFENDALSASLSTIALVPPSSPIGGYLYLAIGGSGLGCYLFAARRHYRLYRRAPSPAGLAITCGIVLFGEALLTAMLSQLYTPSFWLYHIELALGFSVISYAILRTYHRGQSDESLLERMFLTGTRTRLHVEYALAMDALIVTLACAERPTPALRHMLQHHFSLTESQIEVLEQAAAAVAQERHQRQELQRLNTALQQLEEEKNVFTQMLVHDLKSPLAAQSGCLELLQREPLSHYQQLLLQSAMRNGKTLSDLVATLLDITRLEEGRIEIQRSLVPPHDLLKACADELHGWMAEEHKELRIEAAENLPLLHIDLRLIQRVVLNLLSNAIKHTSAGANITLRSYLAGNAPPDQDMRVVVEVADNGTGIPADQLDRIFEKFVRGPQGNRYNSTGLGLAFCRLATEANGGTISVTSSLGLGTTFRLELPGR
jgi:signal transduction histidine kinase